MSDARRLDRHNENIAAGLAAMQGGAALHLEYRPTGAHWRLSDGRAVSPGTALAVLAKPNVAADSDALFWDVPSQTYRLGIPRPANLKGA